MRATPFLMFQGDAVAALDFYAAAFGDFVLHERRLYGDDGPPGAAGTVLLAAFSVGGQRILCSDSFVRHDFTFTPASSLFVDCDSAAEQATLAAALADGGKTLMPLGDYGFSRRFGWFEDRFGVSWQINLP